MAELTETGFILTFDELRILLYSLGYRKVEGIYMPEKEFQEADILLALHHMSAKKLITAEEQEFLIRDDLQQALKVMGAPLETAVWRSDEPDMPEYFLYLVPDRAVVSERYWKKEDTVRLRMFTAAAFEEWKEQLKNVDSRN